MYVPPLTYIDMIVHEFNNDSVIIKAHLIDSNVLRFIIIVDTLNNNLTTNDGSKDIPFKYAYQDGQDGRIIDGEFRPFKSAPTVIGSTFAVNGGGYASVPYDSEKQYIISSVAYNIGGGYYLNGIFADGSFTKKNGNDSRTSVSVSNGTLYVRNTYDASYKNAIYVVIYEIG